MFEVPLKKLIHHNSLFKDQECFILSFETFNIENKIVYDQLHSLRNQVSKIGQFI